LLDTYDLSVVHRAFPLHPEVPEEGMALTDLFRGRAYDLKAMNERMKRLMDAEGLPYAVREKTFNTRLAQELAKWAEQNNKPQIHDALYHAYFVDAVNLGKRSELARIAAAVGLDPAEAERILADRAFKDAVDEDWVRARAFGITGVPTFIAGRRAAVGAQPYEVLEQLVRAAGAKPRVPAHAPSR
jgi:predicted DsbA family dithiol-disulfide isomerase